MKKVIVLFSVLITALVCSASANAGEVALTTIGQSPDAMMVRVLMKSLGIVPDYDAVMKPSALSNQKVFVAVVGGSSKGLGAAGINKEDEVKRSVELFKTAQKKKMKIVVMHIGGEGRRGALTDLFINTSVPYAETLIVVDGGNKDKIFDKLTKSKNIPIKTAVNVSAAKEPLKAVLAGYGVTK
ncbi:MAG: DUF6305 family protein [Synergistaceae bacterium]|nr:DUF6305 family protein [Synergistaceae bacterium]